MIRNVKTNEDVAKDLLKSHNNAFMWHNQKSKSLRDSVNRQFWLLEMKDCTVLFQTTQQSNMPNW